MAALHARAFVAPRRGWSPSEFASLLDSPHVFVVGSTRGFALGRVVADQAELLTIATDPAAQRQGVGRACLAEFEAEAAARGATLAFLEVAEDNRAARGLYREAGYEMVARREGYYLRGDGVAIDALILRHGLD